MSDEVCCCDELIRIVHEFCKGQEWASKPWKDQPHVKPLFDFYQTQETKPMKTMIYCGSPTHMRSGSDDECAHGEVERLSAMVDRLGNALREQNDRWGLYGNESQQALKAFEELKASAALPNDPSSATCAGRKGGA